MEKTGTKHTSSMCPKCNEFLVKIDLGEYYNIREIIEEMWLCPECQTCVKILYKLKKTEVIYGA